MLFQRSKTDLPLLTFELSRHCNLNCRYCYNIWKADTSSVTGATYRQAVKTLGRLFRLANVQQVSLTGGEPFLMERLPELVLFIRLKNKQVNVITNGTVADEKAYGNLTDLGVGLFELPVLSHKAAIHDKLTRQVGSWQRVVQSIKYLKKRSARVVAVIVLTQQNAKDIGQTLEFIHSQGIEQVMLNRFNIGGEGIKEIEALQLSENMLKDGFATANIVGQRLKLRLSSNVCTPVCLLHPKDYPYIAFSYCTPDAERRPLTVDYLGNMRFCNHSPVVMGNIFSDRLSDILTSEYAQSWQTVPDACVACLWAKRCLGGCRAAGEQLGQSLRQVDPVLKDIAGYPKPYIS